MFQESELTKLLFFDIETAHAVRDFAEYDEVMQRQWQRRAEKLPSYDPESSDFGQFYKDNAGLHAEFSRVVCVSCGMFVRNKETQELEFHLSSLYGTDERALLVQLALTLNEFLPAIGRDGMERFYLSELQKLRDSADFQQKTAQEQHQQEQTLRFKLKNKYETRRLVGHNILNFDLPFLCRRFLINRLPLPVALNVGHLKPWEMTHLADTQAYWRFGDNRANASLELLTALFGLPSPKEVLGGQYVSRAFWDEARYDDICIYCEADVAATARVAQALSGIEIMPDAALRRREPKVFHLAPAGGEAVLEP